MRVVGGSGRVWEEVGLEFKQYLYNAATIFLCVYSIFPLPDYTARNVRLFFFRFCCRLSVSEVLKINKKY